MVALSPLHAQKGNAHSVAEAVESLRRAMISGNADSLVMLLADELSYGHSGGLVENKQAFVEKIAIGKSDFQKLAIFNFKPFCHCNLQVSI